MPKEARASTSHRQSPFPLARKSKSVEPASSHRNTATWNAADDELLLSARAAGLNWQATASKHFPSKTANACRKRHERLVERRNHEDWDTRRLNTLATEYMDNRKEIWGPLAAKIGERWNIVEAKCMEKGLRNLQSIARAARRTSGATDEAAEVRGNEEEHERDSGIGCSDAEMEVADTPPALPATEPGPTQATQHESGARAPMNVLPRPPPLPLYQPPPPAPSRLSTALGKAQTAGSSGDRRSGQEKRSRTPDDVGQRSISIQSMLASTPRPRSERGSSPNA